MKQIGTTGPEIPGDVPRTPPGVAVERLAARSGWKRRALEV